MNERERKEGFNKHLDWSPIKEAERKLGKINM